MAGQARTQYTPLHRVRGVSGKIMMKSILLGTVAALAFTVSAVRAQTFTYTGAIDASDPTQVGRLFCVEIRSTVASPKSFPGTVSGTHRYGPYGFTNTNASSIPVFVTLTEPSNSRIFSST